MPGIEDVVKELDRALEKRDVQAVLEFFADAEWTLAPGTFSGKDGIRRYLQGYSGRPVEVQADDC
jgi:ketosteroid isomerase-like protein